MGMDRSTFCIFIFVILFPVLIRADFFTVLPFVETCEIAKQDYWTRNPDVFNAILDPVWHYQNAPPSEGRTWTFGLCDLETSVYPNDTICNCDASITWFLNRYVWLSQTPSTAFDFWVNHQSQTDGGLVWHCDFCHNDSAPTDSPTDSPTDPTPSPEPNNTAAPTPTPTPPSTPSHELPYNCTCVVAGVDYLARYIDVAHSNLDPVYHYQRSGWAEGRFWDCSLCNADSVYREDPICNCTAAAKNYTDSYPWQTGADLGNAFSLWQENWVTKGEIWHCEFCLPTDEHRSIREYSVGLSAGLGAIVGLGVIVSIFAAVMLWLHWDAFQKHGSFYCALILTGVGLSYVSALVLLPRPTDELCLAFPWFLGVAFILVYGCLFVKTWVLYRVWRKAIQYKRTTITPTYIIKGIGIALAFEIAFLIIWTILDPPKVHLEKMVDGTYEYQCKSKNIAFWSVFLCVKGVWLVFGAAMSILTRSVVKEYNESSSIAYAIYNDIGLAIIAVPLAIILGNVPGGVLVIEVAVIVLAFTFTMCILFFDIWYSVLFHEKDILGEKLRNMVQPSRTSTTTTTATISTAATLSHTASSQQV